MAQITEKELAALGDLLSAEQLATAKYRSLAQCTQDAAMKDCYTRMADRHKSHFDALYANLK
jgi:rubrerythrin